MAMKPGRRVVGAHEDGIWSVCWTAKNAIVSGSVDELCTVRDANDLGVVHSFRGNRLGVVSVVVDSAGTLAATSSVDNVIRFWDLDSGEAAGTIDAGPVEAWTLSISPNDRLIAAGTQKGTVNVWSMETKEKVDTLQDDAKNASFAMAVAFSPDGSTVAASCLDGSIALFDVESSALKSRLAGHTGPVRSVAWSPDGLILLSASDDARVHAYDVERSTKPFETFAAHSSWVLDVAAAPDGRHFATCGSDRSVKIWDLNMKCVVTTLETHADQIWSLAYSPDGTKLVSASDDASLHLYNAAQ